MASDRVPAGNPEQSAQRPGESRERTLLAGDRTLLAWYRTAFGACALAVGLGGVVPGVAPKSSDFYRVIGVLFAVLGAIAPLIGVWHYFVFQEDAGPGRLPRINMRFIVGFGMVSSLLGIAIGLVIALGG
jgi:uncharacterized membrane protein YidH (DUF202 family)